MKQVASPAQILLVEDQPIAAIAAKAIISNFNCEVDVANDGETALHFLNSRNYDLVFMDIGLPDISGVELTKKIRNSESTTRKEIPIVALTAEIENKESYYDAGMNAVLAKPLIIKTAQQVLSSLLPYPNELVTLSGEKVIDFEAAVTKMNGNVDAAHEMIELLINDLKKELPVLESAQKVNDSHLIKSIAHQLRGGSTYCGASRLKQICTVVEQKLSMNEEKLSDALFQQLIEEINNVINVN